MYKYLFFFCQRIRSELFEIGQKRPVRLNANRLSKVGFDGIVHLAFINEKNSRIPCDDGVCEKNFTEKGGDKMCL